MGLRRLLGTAAAGAGAVVVADRALTARAGTLDPALDGRQQTFRWRGLDVGYAEAGDPEEQTLVLLHGINAAGSSGEFRAVFDQLAADHHVVAPDLPGFGRSDRPRLRYSASLYEAFVADFLAEFDAPAVVASSLSAAYAVAAARETPVSRFVLICPTTIAGPDPPKVWLRELLRAPVVGQALFSLLVSRPSIRHFNADHGYYDMGHLDSEWIDYEWDTTHQPNARYAVASFVAGHLNSSLDLDATLRDLDVPTTLVWGRETELTPLADGRDLAAAAGARLVVFDDALLLPHVEYPEQFVAAVRGQVAED